jgi:hypothetical protein
VASNMKLPRILDLFDRQAMQLTRQPLGPTWLRTSMIQVARLLPQKAPLVPFATSVELLPLHATLFRMTL